MSQQTPCHTDERHGPAVMIVAGQRYLGSACAHAWTLNHYAQRSPVGVVRQEGGR